MSWSERLKKKWGITSNKQLLIILIVFAFTGTTVVLVKRPIVAFFSVDGEQSTIFSVAYWLLILPFYNVVLLFYGFVFGQFEFFWNYEKKTIGRFTRRRNASPK